ncbi:MAG: hypothetical protein Kilf2KO_39750 [Rhodospirillales bacterium]
MDLVTIEIMREIAVLKGKRSPDGTWKDGSVSALESLLLRAVHLQKRVEDKAEAIAAKAAVRTAAEPGGE